MSFTAGVRRVATKSDCERRWGLDGKSFRCYLCGHRFVVKDGFRWVYYMGSSGRTFELDGSRYGCTNFMVCDDCDGDDVKDRWVERNKEFASAKFWAMRR